MLMTTNTLWTPPASENLATLVELSGGETRLLSELETIAASVAPTFQAAIFARLTRAILYVSPLEYELGKNALEKWFVHLFHHAPYYGNLQTLGEYAPISNSRTLHRKSGIPFRYLLALQEVILKYGKRVTQNSHAPELAYQAFQKVLGLEFALNQIYEELSVSHLTELMLDD
ncbi:MAG: hypothetical protein H6636_02555 [Anaerolineales bacterium]|nr:hypothetical protein [Anaerolineales bacterium]